MIRAAVEEAQAYGGLPVAAHAIGRPGIEAAVRCGVTSIEHGYALDDELRAEMADRGQFLVPTLLETTHDLDPARTSPVAYERGALAPDRAGVGGPLGRRRHQDRHGHRQRPDLRTRQKPQELGLLVELGGLTPWRRSWPPPAAPPNCAASTTSPEPWRPARLPTW
ncbi:hypothetical protein NKH18_36450 [Streptomyces sp. M10(2022)]